MLFEAYNIILLFNCRSIHTLVYCESFLLQRKHLECQSLRITTLHLCKMSSSKHMVCFGRTAVPPPTNFGQPPSTPLTEPAAPPPTVVITPEALSPLERTIPASYPVQRAIARHLDRVSYDRLRSTSRYLRYRLPDPRGLQKKGQLNKWLAPSCNETRNPLTDIDPNQRYTLHDKVYKMFRMYYPPIRQPIPCEVSPPSHRTQLTRCDHGIGGHHRPGEFFFCRRHQLKTREQLNVFSRLAQGATHRLCDRCTGDRLKSVSIADDRFTHSGLPIECGCVSELIGLQKLTVEDQNKCKFCSLRPFFDWQLENQRIVAELGRDAQNCWRHPIGSNCYCKTCIGCHETFNAGRTGDWRCEGFECSRCKKGYFANLPAAVYSEQELRTWESESSEHVAPSLEGFFRLVEISEPPSAP
jgi:hypothetical protein